MAIPDLYIYLYCWSDQSWQGPYALQNVMNCLPCPDIHNNCTNYPQYAYANTLYYPDFAASTSSQYVLFQIWDAQNNVPDFICDNVNYNMNGASAQGIQDIGGNSGYYVFLNSFDATINWHTLLQPATCDPQLCVYSLAGYQYTLFGGTRTFPLILSDQSDFNDITCEFGCPGVNVNPDGTLKTCLLTYFYCDPPTSQTIVLHSVDDDMNKQYPFWYRSAPGPNQFNFFLYNENTYILTEPVSGGSEDYIQTDSPKGPCNANNSPFWFGRYYKFGCFNTYSIQFV
jgi:hypothetical protein